MEHDPWYFQRWARGQKLGNPTRKLILTSLAITAESHTGSGFMAQSDLAEYAECSIRTVSEHLKALEAAGLLARRRRFSKAGRRIADGFLLLAPSVIAWPNGDPPTTGSQPPPEESASGDLTGSPPEAQASEQELPKRTTQIENGSAREDRRLSPPSDFPDELRPHARAILPILEAIAEQHQAQKVWPLSLGKTLMRFKRKALVATAHELDRWAVDPPRPIKDVVGTYATFLDNKRDLQGVEVLDADGLPVGTGGARNGSAGRSATVGRTTRRDRPNYDALIRDN